MMSIGASAEQRARALRSSITKKGHGGRILPLGAQTAASTKLDHLPI
jgi:hypothetical protein